MVCVCVSVSGASVEGDSGKDRQVLYSLQALRDSDGEDCDKLSNMGTLNSSLLHRSANSLKSLGSELDNVDTGREEEEERRVEEVGAGVRSVGAAGVGGGGEARLSEEMTSPEHLPVLRRTRSQTRPQQVKFSDDVLDGGLGAYGDVGQRQAPMSERPTRRVYRLDEQDRRSVQLRQPHHHHHRKRRHGRKTRSDNALHLPPQERAPALAHLRYDHQGASAATASAAQFRPDPKPRLHGHPGPPQRQLSYPHTTSDYALQRAAATRSAHFRGLYADGGDYAYDDDGDDWCSTCSSSSSESEEEGFFLGQPIPRPRAQLMHYYADDLPTPVTALSTGHPYDLRTKSKKRGHRGKNCIIS